MLRKSLFLSLFLSFSLFGSDYLENVFAQPQQRTRIASFIDNVLRQVPSERFLEMVDNSGKSPNLCDAAFYEYMRKNFPSIKNRFAIRNVLKLVSFQKNLLAGQINQLIDANYAINNCLEIGTPGTYMECLKPRISGNIYVVNDQPKYSDRLQAYSFNVRKGFKGYDKFVKLNNYEPIDSSIADNSLDLVICFIGLHHIPAEKLDAFVHSIRRVLRPGGVFLLREHDAS